MYNLIFFVVNILDCLKINTVKPRFWNTFPAKIYVINRFFAADQNSYILHRSPRFCNTFSGIPKSRFYCTSQFIPRTFKFWVF